MLSRAQRAWLTALQVAVLAGTAAADAGQGAGIAFTRIDEPNEGAFSMLVPRGWSGRGGIYRVNAAQAGGPLNAMEAKCDWLLMSDERGTVAFRILPDIVYAHAGIGGGFFPPGSYYQGAEVRALTDAPTHLQTLIRGLHPQASGLRMIQCQRLPGEIESMDRGMAYTNQILRQVGLGGAQFRCDAAGAVYEYTEAGTTYREVMVTGVVDMRAAMTWKNTRTLAFRAPADQFDQWRPLMDVMRASVRFSPQWVLKEAGGQQERARIVLQVHDEIRRIDQEIVQRTSVNRAEIMNDNFLVLTEQEEFVDPHTGAVEVDTDAYRYRWKSAGGDVYFTNREDENPNTFLQGGDYRRTQVRRRRNE